MAFANVPGIFILLLYLKNVNGQQGITNNMNMMGFNSPQGPQQQNVPNFNNFNQVPMNPAGNPNIPHQNLSPQVNMQPTNNFQTLKQVNLQAPNKPTNNGQQPVNVQNINLQKPNTAPVANLQIPRHGNQIQANDMNLSQSPKITGFPTQASPAPLQITSFNFIPVDQIPYGSPNQLTFIPNSPTNTFKAQILPPSLQTIVNFAAQNPSQQNEQTLLQNALATLQNPFNPMGNQQFITQPSIGPVQNQPIFTGVPNQSPFNSIGPAVFTLQGQPSPFISNQPGMIPVQGQSVVPSLSVQSQQPVTPIQLQPIVTYQDQPGFNTFQGSATYIPFSPQYASSNPMYTPFPPYSNTPPKSNKSSSLKAIIPYILNLLQERQKCPCPNCGCMNNDQEPQIFGGYSNQKSYGTLPNEQNLPVVNIDPEDLQTNSRFLREHKNPKKNIVNTESEEVSDEDSTEVGDDGEDNTSDSG